MLSLWDICMLPHGQLKLNNSMILFHFSFIYFLTSLAPLRGGKFHNHLMEKFSPLVVRYIDLMESSIARSVDKGFNKETYKPMW